MARVLVVEDNPVNLELMQYLLASFGYEVLTARDGLEGLALLRGQRPDIVLCDIEMPRLDGLGLVAAARADPAIAATPLVAVTSNAMVGDRARFLAAGFDDHVSKPIDPEAFVHQLSRLLQRTPPAAPAVPTQAEAAPQPAPGAGALILVVDDVPANLELKRSCLEPLGYRVRTALDATRALALALQERPDLIISDVGMPVGDGFGFIARVKQEPSLRDVPFVFVSTTHCDAASRERALALGARRYLERPLPIEQLLEEVRLALAQGS